MPALLGLQVVLRKAKLYPLLLPPARLASIKPAVVEVAELPLAGGPRTVKLQANPTLG